MALVATWLDSAVTEDVSQKLRVKFFKHCCCSVTQSCSTLRYPMECSTLGLSVPRRLPKFMSIALVMPSSYLILWHPLCLLPSIFPSIGDFSSESAVHIRWPKYWSFSFSISPSKSAVFISLKIDWLDLLAVQGALKSPPRHLWAYVFLLVSCAHSVSPRTAACQAPLSMEFPRHKYWSGLPFPFPGNLLDPGIKPKSPALQANSLPSELPGKSR